jgi:hypothetical protein
MNTIQRKRNIAYVMTIVALASLWAGLACLPQMQNAVARGAFAMCTVVLIGLSIVQWSGFLKEYIRFELESNKAR